MSFSISFLATSGIYLTKSKSFGVFSNCSLVLKAVETKLAKLVKTLGLLTFSFIFNSVVKSFSSTIGNWLLYGSNEAGISMLTFLTFLLKSDE